ncbi:metal ABC transporter solute-binding protein, Zn/Mn family [Bacillus suaedaesalsae]|uniref:Zinc ABC transporter substrate-binding protein n=1 Tax=Bacillus suaedaesalsae TaxID=2810349 RepID=A0ABS2DJ80_9BACI|nr:zinc ABC transporter substrate-binding protein [Bacillus suaedaesalsae]MBM6618060.1 zinc ABC transporter substrate-binding protein [Bacillus suaedaesalsae]
MKLFISLFIMFGLFITGCSTPTDTKEKKDVITVTTTTGQIKDAVVNVGGEHVEVESLMGPGVDPHLYQASQGDIRKLTEAEIIFYNGLHLEGKMGEIFEKMSKNKPTVPIGERIPEDKLIKVDSTYSDPHIWFNIDHWIVVVVGIEEELSKLSPEHEQQFKQNAEKYIAELKELKKYATNQMNSIPKEQRILVTAHDAFAYFGNAYSMEVRGLQGLSTDSEYGLKDVQDLVDLLVDRQIKAVFIETSISERSIQAIVEGAMKKGHTVKIGGELFSDAMGDNGTEEGTYIGMYKHNVDTIVQALK